MAKLINGDSRYRRLIIFLCGFIICISVMAFLNYQTDDEIYIGFYDYISYPECADMSDGVVTVDDTMKDMSKGSVIAAIAPMHVDAGSFTLDTDHQSDNDIEVILYDGDKEFDRYSLRAGDTNTRHSFSASDNIYNLRAEFLYSGKGRATIKRSILYSENGAFYIDTAFYAVLIIALAVTIVLLMIRCDIFNRPFYDKLCFFGAIGFMVMINYLIYRPFSDYSVDMTYHLSRIEHTYLEMKRGEQLPIVLYPEALQGRGEIMILYPYLLLFIPAIIRFIGVSPDGAIRFFILVINVLTCLTSYYTVKRITSNKYISVFFMVVYNLLTYRLTVMTYRWAYGEFQAFVFMPLVFLGLYEILIRDKKKWPILVLGMTGLLQCHTISTIQAIIICLIVGILFIDKLILERRIIHAILSIIFTLFVNLWYIVPFLYYYKSDIDVEGHLKSADMTFITYYVADWLRLIPNTVQGAQRHHQIGIIGWGLIIVVLLSGYFLVSSRKLDIEDRLGVTYICTGVFLLSAASKFFPWETLQKFIFIDRTIGNIQFTTRFYLGAECALLFGSIIIITQRELSALRYKVIMGIILILFITQGTMIIDSFLSGMDPFIERNKCRYTADIPNLLYESFVPEGYWGQEDFPQEPESEGAYIVQYEHKGIYTSFEYKAGKKTYVDLPLLFYTGYEAYVENGRSLNITKGREGCLRIELPAMEEMTSVHLVFSGFSSWIIAGVVSCISIVILLSYLVLGDSIQRLCQQYNRHPHK